MTTNSIKNLQFQIGEWVFSPAERTLFHLEQETNVDLDQRTAQLLHLFIQRANEVLSREEIIEAIWDRSVVTDHAVTQSIFELRRVLRGNRSDAPNYIRTLPKLGYQLVIPVSEIVPGNGTAAGTTTSPPAKTSTPTPLAAPSPLANRPKLGRHWLLISLISLFVSLAILGFAVSRMAAQPDGEAKPGVLPNPRQLTVTYPMLQDDGRDSMLVGLADFIVYKLNALTSYDVLQLPHNAPSMLSASGRVLSFEWVNVGGKPFVQAKLLHRISNQKLLEKRYPAMNLYDSMNVLLEDLLQILENKSIDSQQAAAIAENYPVDPEVVKLFFRGHFYLFSKGDKDSLKKGIRFFREMSKTWKEWPILYAELAMSELMLSELTGDESWRNAAAQTFEQLDRLADKPFLPPVVYEAWAMRALYGGDRKKAMSWINRALNFRDTWHGEIIRGKLYEIDGKTGKAGDSYTRAYMLKPDKVTLLWATHMAFQTDISKVAPSLANSQ